MLEKKEIRENGQIVLTIHIGMGEWKKALKDCYEQGAEQYGLDKNVSREDLEKQYGAEFLYQEAVNATYPDALEEILHAEDIRFIGSPQLGVDSIGPEGYTFTAILDPFPMVPEFDYKGMDASMPDTELNDEDRKYSLNSYLQAHPPVTHPDVAADGDEVVIDYDGSIDGVHFEGGKAEKYPLVLGSGYFIPGFEEQIVGAKVGEERDIHVTFPQQYEPSLAGKDAVFHIKVHEINRMGNEMTEEYAHALGFDTLEALKEEIFTLASIQKKQFRRDTLGMELASNIALKLGIAIPETAVNSQSSSMINQLKAQLQSQGSTMEDYLKASKLSEEQLHTQYRENAAKSIRAAIILAEIVARENIIIDDAAIQEEYAAMQRRYSVPEKQLRTQMSPDALRRKLALRHARDLIINSANLH